MSIDVSQIETFLDDLVTELANERDLFDFVGDMDEESIRAFLTVVRARLQANQVPEDRERLAIATGRLLLAWAIMSSFDDSQGSRPVLANQAAEAAAEIFAVISPDEDMAAFASLSAGVLRLDPNALADVYDRFGEELGIETRIRLLRLLAGSAGAEFNRRFGPLLAEAVAASRKSVNRDETVAAAKALILGGAAEDGADETLGQLEDEIRKTPRDSELRGLYVQAASAIGTASRGRDFLLDLSRGFHDDFKPTLLIEASTIELGDGAGCSGALNMMESAIEENPANEELRRHYREQAVKCSALERAASFAEKLRVPVGNSDVAVSISIWQGRLLDMAGRMDDAEKVWRRVRSVNPGSHDALEFYVRYHEGREEWLKMFSTLQFELTTLNDDAERVDVNRRMAAVAANRLNKLDKAAEAYKRILAITPHDIDAFDALVDILEKSARWNALVELYNERIRKLEPEAIDEKVALLFRIVDIYSDEDKLPSRESMLAAYARVVEVSPTNAVALKELETGYETGERWPDLLKILQRKVEITSDTNELLDLFHRISEIAIDRMSNENQAIPFLEKILELDPHNLEVVKRLETIYARRNNQERQYLMLKKQLEMVQPGPGRVPLLLAAADLARDRLRDDAEALRMYEEVYRLDGRCREARENLHLLYNRLESWSDYARFLTSEVECEMPTVRRIELLHKLGEINLEHLGDIDNAEEVYNRVLKIEPADEIAANRLERIYIERGEFESIYQVYKGRGEIRRFVAQMAQYELRDARLARELSLLMARVCEVDLKDPSRALDYLEDAFISDPTDETIGRRVVEAATARNDSAMVERTLNVLAANGKDPARQQADHVALAAIFRKGGRVEAAFESISSAIHVFPKAPGLADLVDMAVEIASEAGLWQPLASLLEDVVIHATDPEWAADIRRQLGHVYLDRLLFHDEARKVFEALLEHDPDDAQALDTLEVIVMQQEDYTGLESVLRRRLAVATDPAARQSVHLRLGALYEDLLNDDEKASESYEAALELKGEPDRVALSGLHRTLERMESWERLAGVIRQEREVPANDRDRVRLDTELAQILVDGLGEVDEALSILDGVLSSEGGESALAQVEAIFESGRDTDIAGSILQSSYRQNNLVDKLVHVLQTRIERSTSPGNRAALLVELADVRLSETSDVQGAFKAVADSVGEFPTEENVSRMIELAGQVDGYATAAKMLDSQLERADSLDPELEAWMSARLGELYGHRLGEPELAVIAMERALPFMDTDSSFLAELLSLYRTTGNVDAAMMTFLRLADCQKDTERRQTLIERALFAVDNHLLDEAVTTLRGLSELEFDPEVDSMLEEILEEHGRFGDLITHLERKAGREGYEADMAAIHFSIAGIYLDHMKLPADAARHVGFALDAAPGSDAIVAFAEAMVSERTARGRADWAPGLIDRAIESLRSMPGAESRLINMLRMRIEGCDSPSVIAAALGEIARVECARGNTRECFDSMMGALRATPDDPEALDLVIGNARGAGFVADAVEGIVAIAEPMARSDRQRLLMAAAGLAAQDGNDVATAERIYVGLADRYPDSVEALVALDGLHAARGDAASRIPILARMADLADDTDERRDIRFKAGLLAAEVADWQGALELLGQVIDERQDAGVADARAIAAAATMVDAAMALERFEVAAGTLMLVAGSVEGDARREHLIKAAAIVADSIGDGHRALGLLMQVLDDNQADVEARSLARDLARKVDDTTALLSILRGDAEMATDAASGRAARLESVTILIRPDVGRGQEAIDTLAGIVSVEPGDAGAIEMLRRLMAAGEWDLAAADVAELAADSSGDRALAIDVLRVRERHATEPVEKAAILQGIGAACAAIGMDVEAADAFGDALACVPTDPAVLAALFAEMERQGAVTRVVDYVRGAVGGMADKGAANSVRTQAAARLASSGEVRSAVELLQDALGDREDDPEAIRVMIELSRQVEDWERHVAALKLAVVHIYKDLDERADAMLDCARISAGKLEDQDAAVHCYREVLALRPLDPTALDVLSGLLERNGDKEGLRGLWKTELDARLALPEDQMDKSRTAWLLQRVAESALEAGAADEVRDAVIRLASLPDLEPSSMDAACRLFKKQPEPPIFEAVSAMLTNRGDQRRLLDVYRFCVSARLAEPTAEFCLRRAVEIEEKLRLHDFRFEDLGRLVEAAPGDVEALNTYVDVAGRLGRIPRALPVLEKALEANQDSEAAFGLAMTIADLLQNKLGRPEDATDFLRLAFLRHPDDEEVIRRLAGLYEELKRYSELALLYESLGEMAPEPEKRVKYYFDACGILRSQVKSPDGATDVLKKILDVDPNNQVAVDELEEIARETGNDEELAVWVGHKADLTTDQGQRRDLRMELAGILARVPDRAMDATAVLDQIVDENPDDEDAWSMYENILKGLSAFDSLADMYMKIGRTATGSTLRLASLKKAASVFEARLQDRYSAVNALEMILALEPADNFAFERLSVLLGESSDFDNLLKLYTTREEALEDEAGRAAMNLRIADVLHRRMGRTVEALERYRKVIDFDPRSEEARTGLLDLVSGGDCAVEASLALEAVFVASGENDRLLDILRRQADLATDQVTRATLLVRAGAVQSERMGQHEGALRDIADALVALPGFGPALDLLSSVAAAGNVWQAAYAVVATAVEDVIEDDDVARMRRLAGDIAIEHLNDATSAAMHYGAYLLIDPDCDQVLERQDQIFGQLGRRDDQVKVLRQRLALAGDNADGALKMRLAEMLVENSRDPDSAFELVRGVLTAEPSNQHAIGLMSVLQAEPLFQRRASDALRRAYLESGDNDGLLKAVEAQIGGAREVSDLVEMHTQAAVAAAGLGMTDRELEHVGAALALDPSNDEILQRAIECIDRAADGRATWNILRTAAKAASWQDLEKKLLLLAVDRAGKYGFNDPKATEDALKRVLEIDPSNRQALELLDENYTKAGRHSDVISVLRHRLRLDLGAAERTAVHDRIAGIYEAQGQDRHASEAYQEAIETGAAGPELLKRARECYKRQGNVRAEIETIERMVSAAPDHETQFAALLEIAALQREELKDVRAARATVERIIAEDEFHNGARVALEEIYEELEDWDSLVRLLNYAIESDLDPEERLRLALKAASIAANELENPTLAISFARKASQIDPSSDEVNGELLRLYFKVEDWSSLIAVMRRRASFEKDPHEKIVQLSQAAAVAHSRIGDNKLAAMIADEILAIDPEQPEALLTVAGVRESEGKLEDALGMFRRLSTMNAGKQATVEAFLGIARLLGRLGGDPTEIGSALQAAAGLDPDHPDVRYLLKDISLERGDYGKVLELLKGELEAAKEDAARSALSMEIAEIYRKHMGDGASFLEWAERAWTLSRDDSRVVTTIVDHLLAEGQDQKAVPYLEWLVTYLEAKRMLKELPPYANALGRILEQAGDTRKAVDFYRICHEHDSTNIGNVMALGRLHMKHGDVEKAARVFQPLLLRMDSLALDQRREVLLSLAQINELRGDTKKARQFITRLLSEQPDCAEARSMLGRL